MLDNTCNLLRTNMKVTNCLFIYFAFNVMFLHSRRHSFALCACFWTGGRKPGAPGSRTTCKHGTERHRDFSLRGDGAKRRKVIIDSIFVLNSRRRWCGLGSQTQASLLPWFTTVGPPSKALDPELLRNDVQ